MGALAIVEAFDVIEDLRASLGAGFNIGDVGHPELIGGGGFGSVGQAVGSNRLVVVAVGRLDAIAPLLATAQALLLHQTGNTIAPMASSLLAQLLDHARATVGLAAT